MKTQDYTATMLDGFIATEDDSLDWQILHPTLKLTDVRQMGTDMVELRYAVQHD
jgi:hypothetical protein